MIKVKDKEKAIRTVEAFNALSVVLPIYDDEAQRVFRASFGIDMAELMPSFFRDLALMSLKNEEGFDSYANYFEELIRYVNKERKEIPKPKNSNDSYFIHLREQAEKLLNAWMVKEK